MSDEDDITPEQIAKNYEKAFGSLTAGRDLLKEADAMIAKCAYMLGKTKSEDPPTFTEEELRRLVRLAFPEDGEGGVIPWDERTDEERSAYYTLDHGDGAFMVRFLFDLLDKERSKPCPHELARRFMEGE